MKRTFSGLFIVLLIGVPCASGVAYGDDRRNVPKFLKEELTGDSIEIEDVSVVSRDTDQIKLSWETTEPAYGRIEFGRDQSDFSQNRSLMDARTTHTATLRNLTEGTDYYFQIEAWTTNKNRVRTKIGRVRTGGVPPPQIKDITLHKRLRSGGVLRIETNIPTQINFRSGHDTKLEYTTEQEHFSRRHQISLDHFHPDRTVYYQFTLEDQRGRTMTSPLKTFRTRENNVAFQKPVTGTFDEVMYGAPDGFGDGKDMNNRITDGDYSFQNGTATSGDPADTEQWFQVAIGELTVPDTAVLYWFGFAFPRNYKIQGSKLGQNWQTLAENLDARDGTEMRKGGIKTFKHTVSLDHVDESYQFFRVVIPENADYRVRYKEWTYVQVQEFKLFPKKEEIRKQNFRINETDRTTRKVNQ